MKKTDFKQHKFEYIETCRRIIELKGKCNTTTTKCIDCPFSSSNIKNQECSYCGTVESGLDSAIKYLKLYDAMASSTKDLNGVYTKENGELYYTEDNKQYRIYLEPIEDIKSENEKPNIIIVE